MRLIEDEEAVAVASNKYRIGMMGRANLEEGNRGTI